MARTGVMGEPSSSNGPHRMRITSGGQVSGYVNFALTFLKENPNRALILHTLPPSKPESGASKERSSIQSSSSLNPALLATPKLVSVAEKIKREYMAHINSTSSKGKGKNKAVGIWQYTESGTLESGEAELGLESVLEGRLKPKLVHRPYLQITLSTKPLGLEEGVEGRNITCQYVMTRRKKDSAESKPVKANEEVAQAESASAKDGINQPEEIQAGGEVKSKNKGEKRKSESNGAGPDATRGKKRKK